MAKLTIFGIEHYLNMMDDSLFKNVTFPASIDRETLINNIMLRAGEFEALYADPDFLKIAVETWGKKYSRTFTKWADALAVSYNPLENYDREESWTDETSGNVHNENSGTSTDKISAFDSLTFEDKAQNIGNGESDTVASNTVTHTARVHGNIGVTTSQQMLQSELDIAKWSIIEQITDLFTSEFTIAVY